MLTNTIAITIFRYFDYLLECRSLTTSLQSRKQQFVFLLQIVVQIIVVQWSCKSKVSVCVFILYIFFQKLKSLTWNALITSQTALEKLCPAMPHITKLSLTNAHYDDKCDGLLRAIAANLHHLKYLNFSKSEVDPKAIEYLLPTEDNVLGGCPKLVELDLWNVKNVDVKLLKKLILALPKLRSLKHWLLVNGLAELTEEEMGVDTARCFNSLYALNVSYRPIRFDLLAKSPAFQRFKNNIATIDMDAPKSEEGQQKSALLADVLMWLPNLKNVTLFEISEADHHVSSLLETIGDRLESLTFINSLNLNVQNIMRTCKNLVRLTISLVINENNPPMNVSNIHQDQVEKPSKFPELNYLTEIYFDVLEKDVCSADMLIALLQSPCLNKITLCNVEAMSDDVMWNVLLSRGCTALSKVIGITVSECALITAEPFVHWLTKENCSLQYMRFKKCEKVDYQRLGAAAGKCSRAVIIQKWS